MIIFKYYDMCIEDEFIDTKYYSPDIMSIKLSEEDLKSILKNRKSENISYTKLLNTGINYINTNNLNKFRKLIENNPHIVNEKVDGTYLLHYACKKGRHEIVSHILFNNGNSKIKDDSGFYPQHYGVMSGKSIIIDILMVFGNNINVIDKNKNSCLHHSVLLESKSMVKTLLGYEIDHNIKNKKNQKAIDLIDSESEYYDLLINLMN